jgi:hypothetical protein
MVESVCLGNILMKDRFYFSLAQGSCEDQTFTKVKYESQNISMVRESCGLRIVLKKRAWINGREADWAYHKGQSIVVPLTMFHNISSALYQLHEEDTSYIERFFLESAKFQGLGSLPFVRTKAVHWSWLARDIDSSPHQLGWPGRPPRTLYSMTSRRKLNWLRV